MPEKFEYPILRALQPCPRSLPDEDFFYCAYCIGRRFHFVRGEGARLFITDYRELSVDKSRNILGNVLIVNRFAQPDEMEESVANGAGSRTHSRISTVSNSKSSLFLSLSLRLSFFLCFSLFLTRWIESESLLAMPRARSSGESRGTINLDIPLDITWPRLATVDKFYRAC